VLDVFPEDFVEGSLRDVTSHRQRAQRLRLQREAWGRAVVRAL